jgi:hypothetical protein
MKPKFSRYLPQVNSPIKLGEETKKRLIINLIEFGKFTCDDIVKTLSIHDVNGITNKVVENVFKENMTEFEKLPDNYLSNFNKQ